MVCMAYIWHGILYVYIYDYMHILWYDRVKPNCMLYFDGFCWSFTVLQQIHYPFVNHPHPKIYLQIQRIGRCDEMRRDAHPFTHYELGPQRCLHQGLDIDFFFWTVGCFSFIEPQVSYGKTTTNIGFFCRNGHSITDDLGGQGSKALQPTGSGHC